MVIRGDIKHIVNTLKNMTCVINAKSNSFFKKYKDLLGSAEEKYGEDDKFEQYEQYLIDRIDSEDIVKFRDFSRDVNSYTNKVNEVLGTVLDGGIYILLEKQSTNFERNIDDYDIMCIAYTEKDAMEWRDKNPQYRKYKWCNMREAVIHSVRE